jgi:hypothetical protein
VKYAHTLSLEIRSILFEIKWRYAISSIGHFVNLSLHEAEPHHNFYHQAKNFDVTLLKSS